MGYARTLQWLERHPEIDSLRAAVCDLNGALRGKRIPADQARKALAGELRMPLSVVSVDVWGEDVADNPLTLATGDRDGACEWTGRDILPIDWLSRPTALVPLWLTDTGGVPYAVDPRRALAAVVERYAQAGLTPVVATELEFYLVDPQAGRPAAPRVPGTQERLDSDGILAIDELDHFDALINEIYAACSAQAIPADAAIAENGMGQFEINLRHGDDPLRAADDALYFKRTVKGVARKHGLAATFMARPYGELSGNGLHVHFSLLDRDGENVFDDGSDQGSELMHHAVGGLLDAMPESTLLFAPHLNSYRRLGTGALAPDGIAWGYENRTTAVRIPGGAHAARRIEHRVAGADANPYLVLAAILGAALIGIERGTRAPDPITGNAYALDLPRLHGDWASSIDAFEAGDLIASIFPSALRRTLVACKRQEHAVFAAEVSELEHRTYLDGA